MLCMGTGGGTPGGATCPACGTTISRSVKNSAPPAGVRDLCPDMRRRQRVHSKGDSEFTVCPGALHTRGPLESTDLAALLAADVPTNAAAP